MSRTRISLIWAGVVIAVAVPLVAAAMSPLLQWRQPVYIIGGFAGVVGLALIFFQPLLMGGYLPGLPARSGRRVHLWVGGALVAAVVIHVAALWITSPPDVVDALLFRAPTPFSVWGVIAMWALFAVAFIVIFRRKLIVRPRAWRIAHTSLAIVVVAGTVVHAFQIEGTMELISKAVLCALVVAATAIVMADLKVWGRRGKSRREAP